MLKICWFGERLQELMWKRLFREYLIELEWKLHSHIPEGSNKQIIEYEEFG